MLRRDAEEDEFVADHLNALGLQGFGNAVAGLSGRILAVFKAFDFH